MRKNPNNNMTYRSKAEDMANIQNYIEEISNDNNNSYF